ncbi:fimbrial protein [Sodalis sp. RH19]|uniref:fimbrial protein n=1 Tax=unclassified Sodalis (in: enterobacteria) TaxID=2636512 RepID=UPI0039B3ECE1
MKQQRILWSISALLATACAALAYTPPAMAACTTTGASQTGAPVTLTLARDKPNGLIGNPYVFPSSDRYSCAPAGITQQQFGLQGNSENITGEVSAGRNIYKLGDTGLGYIVYGDVQPTGDCVGSAYIGTGPQMGGDANTVQLCSNPSGYIPQLTGGATITFYKLGPVTPGTLPSTHLASFINVVNGSDLTLPAVSLFSGIITVIVNACSVTNTAITVPMGNVDRAEFTAIGSTAGLRGFTIPLDCNPGINVRVQFDGISAGSATNVLALSPSSSPPAATGVGVQILYNSNPVTLGAPLAVGTTTAAGFFNIPLEARYYQTESTVTPGLANSTATFTLTYQ